MSAGISQSLPYAFGIALSALPIVVVALVAATTRPLRVSGSFVLGWAAGILAVAALIVGLVDTSVPPRRLSPVAGGVVRLILGAVVAVLAVRAFRARSIARGVPPKWISSVSGWSPSRALAIGFTLGSVNPKSLALVAAGATAILGAASTTGQQAAAVIVFAIVASIGVAVPVLVQSFGGKLGRRGLARACAWMITRGKAISGVVLAAIAILLVVAGLSRVLGR